MTVNKNEVVWYEAQAFGNSAVIAAQNSPAAVTVEVTPETLKYLAVDDVVVLKPGVGSTTTEVQAVISAINTNTNVVTLDTAVACEIGDYLMFAYNRITH